ncbi:N-6 DNA methylase [Nocardiopsis dassonvillei]|uniref:N-6 DNA methylase n=1 Tax=Nocardiopsis dassonvillei (strain ATCC 23218 / DSM 43111 / CIP 107115 / JCM 7437 / KCTC 9190 / NBRC 14626 / NCTC 10488 / NRRL B-5397 / IMRU 509) TaxID=446468 RepID=D7AYU2_NOCDD|nr:N-6 DNA methylase [Nocardiopsis dassonvillei]ADH68104.1 N-6 DNA methylase [Nocardiopsis dassonvillei subsp. dassonvillei DSM 43111]NKY77251.1 N-6 DNA methylase [Nocardiopsis dassonvillei]VEI88604.1 Probable type I restriction enzyme BthVORF4518P M protein [Nocardiopsis dassonvillei]
MGSGEVEVSSADIARIAGVKPTAVSNWRRRHDDFPRPVGGTDRSPRFDLGQVEEWLSTHRRAPSIDPDQRLWQALDSLRGSVPVDAALVRAGVLLWHLSRDPGTGGHSAGEPGKQDGSALAGRAWRDFEGLLEGAGLAALAEHRPEPVPDARLAPLADAAVRAVRESDPRTAFERLLSRLDQRSPSGSHTVPPELADLMVVLAGIANAGSGPEDTVADPACGRGGLLLAAARGGRRALLGQDRDAASVWLAALRLAFAGALTGEADLRVSDALRLPAFAPDAPDGADGADAVVCAPPFGERNWGVEELAEDPRWTYGVPPRLESDLAWVQHCLSLVRPGGSAVVLMPPGAAQRPSGRRIRRSLLRAGAFRAVVSLPPGFAAHYAVPLQLWVLRRPERDAVPAPVLLVDTAPHEPGQTCPPGEVLGRIDRLWREYLADPEDFDEHPGVARTLEVADLLDEDVDLTPRARLPVPRAAAGDLDLFAERRTRLEGALRTLRTLLPEAPRAEPGGEAVGVVTLGELARAGSVTIRRPLPRRSAEEAGPRTSARVVTGEDVARGAGASRTEEVDADPMRNPPIQEGDVLIPAVAPRPAARVATGDDAGAYPGGGLYVVRTNPGAVDPWFLAGFVTSSGESRNITRMSSSMRGRLRIDPSRMRLPVLPVEEQRRYGELFRRAARFREALLEFQGWGEELADQAVDLVAGRWETSSS